MQVGGGVIVLLLAIAMVLGKESTFKGLPAAANENGVREAAIRAGPGNLNKLISGESATF
jgi:small neutral amino acid transporter SnatA (MarC family)